MKFLLHFKSSLLMLVVLSWGVGVLHAHETDKNPEQDEKLLIEILDEISREHQLYFTYDSDLIKGVTVDYEKREGESVHSILTRVLVEVNMDYKIFEERFVILYSKDEAGLKSLEQMISHMEEIVKDRKEAFASRRVSPVARLQSDKWNDVNRRRLVLNVTGRVMDTSGEPLIGVNVQVKGTNKGTATDIDGRFSFSDIDDRAVLVLSYIGYKTQEISVDGKTSLTIMMQEDAQTLDEVVVVGYGTQKKANLSGAVESVSAKKLNSRPTNNIGLALQGVVPSLNINPGSGQADATPSYNIRGMTSINGGSPLIMVDGVPTEPADFSRMSSSDIENVSILKDASSAAIYGARAAYGVILVTTKKGETEKLTVHFNNNFNMRTPTRMPSVVLDPYIQASYKVVMGQPWYDLYDEEELEYAKQRVNNPSLPEVIPNFKDSERWSYIATTDWYDELFNSVGTSNSHNVNISGMTDKVSYYFGADYYSERGILKHNTDIYNKYNLRSHIEYNPIDWLVVGNNTSLLRHTYEKPQNFGSYVFNTSHKVNSLLPVKNPDGTWTNAKEGSTVLGNIVGTLQNGGQAETKQYTTQTQFNADVEILKNVWHVKSDFTIKYANNNWNTWDSDRNIPTRSGPNMPIEYFGWDNFAQVSSWNTLYMLSNIYTDFTKTWDKHNFTALVGFSQENEQYQNILSRRENLISDAYPTPQLAVGESTIIENTYEWAIRSGFFRLNYIFNNRFILEANGRYDGTSRFPQNDRFGFFPSFSGAWIISEENFFSPIRNIFNHTKIRMSYGSLGNQDVNYYQYIANMVAAKVNLLLNGERPMGVYPPGLVSNALTWEKVQTTNFGLDLNLLSDKLIIVGDYYHRNTKDMLTKSKTLPKVLGTSEPKTNAADLKTKGWEVSLMWNDHFNLGDKTFTYSSRFILSDSRAYITRFDNPTNYLGDYYEGQEIGEIWGMVTEGFFKDEQDIENHASQWDVTSYPGDRPIEPGDLKYKDINGDGEINKGSWTKDDPGDFKIIGNNSNRYVFGLDVDAEWNGFDFRMLFQGVGKKDWYPSGYKFFGIYTAPWGNVLENNLDHWTPENPEGYFPRLKSYLANGNGDMSYPQTRYLQNAAYVRMKNITFGYTLPDKLISRIRMQGNVRIYFSGENLFEFTKLVKSYDPEALNEHTHPFQRTYSLGLNITF